TPAHFASSSAVSCAKPRYSIASYIRPSTRAVSFTVSLCPMCEPEGPMKVTCAPWSKAATSNAQRVLVESFSKISAISLPTSFCSSRPSFLAAFNSAASSIKYVISSGLKSASFNRCFPRRSTTVLMIRLLSSCLTDDRAGHAVASAASATELLPGDCENLDSCLGELGVGRLVAFVRDDDARLERHDVVAVVPLRALRLELVPRGRGELEALGPERILLLVGEAALRYVGLHSGRTAGREQNRPDLVDDRLV